LKTGMIRKLPKDRYCILQKHAVENITEITCCMYKVLPQGICDNGFFKSSEEILNATTHHMYVIYM